MTADALSHPIIELQSSLYSVLVLTKDEEINIADCLASVPSGVETVVLDSISTDRTTEIARLHGAKIYYRSFDNYAAQRNYGLNAIAYSAQWVLMLDADERLTPELHDEIQHRLRTSSLNDAMFRMRRKDMFMGRWLKRSSGYPTWFGRLARIGSVRVEREINEEFLSEGDIGYLNNHLIHYPFNRGIDYWVERHNRYSTMEASKLIEESSNKIAWRKIARNDPVLRRKWIKQIAYRLPGRPIFIFIYLYFVRMGFLDGRAGFNFCKLRLIYELMIDTKIQAISDFNR